MFTRIFRYTLILLTTFSTLSLVYAQEKDDHPQACWEKKTYGKLTVCFSFPEHPDQLLRLSETARLQYMGDVESTRSQQKKMFKNLGNVLEELEKVEKAPPSDREKVGFLKQHAQNIRDNIRGICGLVISHCSKPILTTEDIATADPHYLLEAIHVQTLEFTYTGELNAYRGRVLTKLRRNTEVLAKKVEGP